MSDHEMTAAEYIEYQRTGVLPVVKTEIDPANERVFTDLVLRTFRNHFWMAYHTYDARRSEPGFPDIIAAHAHHGLIFAELKMPSGRVSPAQQRWIDTLERLGARVYLWRPENWPEIESAARGERI